MSFTHTQLQTAIEDWVEDHGDDMAADFDTALGNAEVRLLKDLDLTIFDGTSNVTLNSATPTKPAAVIVTRELEIPSLGLFLFPRTWGYIKLRYPSGTGRPKHWADLNETQYLLGPTPDVSYAGVAYGTLRPNGLAVDTTGTFLSTKAPDALFSAVLKEVVIYLQREDQQAIEADYQTKLASARYELRALRRRDYSNLAPEPTAAGKPER